jgi:hypothetical protein
MSIIHTPFVSEKSIPFNFNFPQQYGSDDEGVQLAFFFDDNTIILKMRNVSNDSFLQFDSNGQFKGYIDFKMTPTAADLE